MAPKKSSSVGEKIEGEKGMKRLVYLMGIILILITGGGLFGDNNLLYDDMMEKVVLLFNSGGGGSLESWLGSGVIISFDGYIVTNRHVAGYYVKEDGEDEYGEKLYTLGGEGAHLLVYNKDWGYGGCRTVAVSTDPDLDLALLKVETVEDLPYATIASNNNIGPGLEVYAVGHPLGVGWMITRGVVSKVFNTLRHNKIIVHDASINPGNSGGPLFDEFGQIVGLNYAAIPPYAAENISIAIDARMLGEFILLSIAFDQERTFVMTESDYDRSTWDKRYFTYRFEK